MSLLDEATERVNRPGTPCAIDKFRTSDPQLYAELLEALASSVQISAIARALKDRGLPVPSDTLGRHRRGDCVRCHS